MQVSGFKKRFKKVLKIIIIISIFHTYYIGPNDSLPQIFFLTCVSWLWNQLYAHFLV